MYKRICCFLALFLLVGCSVSTDMESSGVQNNREVLKKEITCTVDDSSFTLMLEDGQIVSYIDSVDGDLGQEPVDILNEEHLVGVNDNDEALRIMDTALKDLDGYCE